MRLELEVPLGWNLLPACPTCGAAPGAECRSMNAKKHKAKIAPHHERTAGLREDVEGLLMRRAISLATPEQLELIRAAATPDWRDGEPYPEDHYAL